MKYKNRTLSFLKSAIHMSFKNFRFLSKIMIFDNFQFAIFNLFNKKFFHYNVVHVDLSNMIIIFLKYLQNIDIIISNFFDVFDKIKIKVNVIV